MNIAVNPGFDEYEVHHSVELTGKDGAAFAEFDIRATVAVDVDGWFLVRLEAEPFRSFESYRRGRPPIYTELPDYLVGPVRDLLRADDGFDQTVWEIVRAEE